MMKITPVAILAIPFVFLFPYVVTAITDQQRLIRDLFLNYDPKFRPVYRHTDTILMNVTLKLGQILDISYKDSTATIALTLILQWSDGELEWNPVDYGGLTQLVLPRKAVWVPDVSLVNRKDRASDLSKEKTFVRVHESGLVQWWTFQIVKVIYDRRLSEGSFPAETYSIPFQISTAPYSKDQLEILGYGAQISDPGKTHHAIDISEFFLSTDWDVIESSANLSSVNQTCCLDSDAYNLLTYTMKIKRYPNLYIIANLIPMIILTCLPLIAFLLPVDSKQKVFFGASCLAALVIFRQQLDENAQYFYGDWLNFGIFIHLFILVANITSITVYSKTSPLSEWFKRGLEQWSKLLLLEFPKDETPQSPLVLETSLDAVERDSGINQLALHFKAQGEQESLASDWQHFSRILDRSFGIIFTLICIISSLVLACSCTT